LNAVVLIDSKSAYGSRTAQVELK